MKRTACVPHPRRGASTIEHLLVIGAIGALLGAMATLGSTMAGGANFGAVASALSEPDSIVPADAGAEVTPDKTSASPGANSAQLGAVGMLAVTLCLLTSLVFVRRDGPSKPKPATAEAAESLESIEEEPLTITQASLKKRDSLFASIYRNADNWKESQIRVRHLMSRNPDSIAPETPASEVCWQMAENRRHHLLVARQGRLLGVISDRDLVRPGKLASDLMTAEPITTSPDERLTTVVGLMINKRISCLPVVLQGKLCGVLTRTDLLVAFQCTLQTLTKLELHTPHPSDAGTRRAPSDQEQALYATNRGG